MWRETEPNCSLLMFLLQYFSFNHVVDDKGFVSSGPLFRFLLKKVQLRLKLFYVFQLKVQNLKC